MNLFAALAIGAIVGGLGAATVYFDPRVPARHWIVAAGTLNGALVGLLTGFSLAPQSTWLAAAGMGILYGVVSILVVVLSKGKDAMGHAMFMVPSAAVTGAITGVLVGRFAF
jgi:hypothetical protein